MDHRKDRINCFRRKYNRSNCLSALEIPANMVSLSEAGLLPRPLYRHEYLGLGMGRRGTIAPKKCKGGTRDEAGERS